MIGEILYFAESLLGVVIFLFAVGVVLRMTVFVAHMIADAGRKDLRDAATGPFASVFRSFFPFHRGVLKKPLYAAVRYVFHICMVVVPIWYSGHIVLWEESGLGWYWTHLPDEWIDEMTLVFLIIGGFFLIRRIAFPKVRKRSSIQDFVIIVITIMPYLTGYLYVQGTLDHIDFFSEYLWHLHMLSGEVMLTMIVFLFCRTRLFADRCTGCAACAVNCPTGTLEATSNDGFRNFGYSHYQCICCGECVSVCPEGASELRHEISPVKLFNVFSKEQIRSVELAACEGCGVLFAPVPKVQQLKEKTLLAGIESTALNYCDRCRKLSARRPGMMPVASGGLKSNIDNDNV